MRVQVFLCDSMHYDITVIASEVMYLYLRFGLFEEEYWKNYIDVI